MGAIVLVGLSGGAARGVAVDVGSLVAVAFDMKPLSRSIVSHDVLAGPGTVSMAKQVPIEATMMKIKRNRLLGFISSRSIGSSLIGFPAFYSSAERNL